MIGETQTTVVRDAVQGVTRDVTELRRLQDRLAALALRDPLTGLANRRLLDELLDAELARTQRNDVPLAVAYIDLDGLKQVNDTYGHDAGDAVLCEAARRLVSIVRGADVVARLGGDEFVVVYEPRDPSRILGRSHRRAPAQPIARQDRRSAARAHDRALPSCSLPPTTRCTRSNAAGACEHLKSDTVF